MSEEIKRFENEDFLVEARETPGCLLDNQVTVRAKIAQAAYKKAVKAVNKSISIPGFRKGHAPDRTIISRHASYVDQEWKELLANEAYRAVLALTGISPFQRDSVQKVQVMRASQEEGALVRIVYEHAPHIPFIALDQVVLPLIAKSEIGDEAVAKLLEQFRELYADYRPVLDQSPEEGNLLEITLEAVGDTSSTLFLDHEEQVLDEKFPGWLKELVLPLQAGGSVEGQSGKELFGEEIASQKVRVTLHAVKKKVLPEVDLELAQKLGCTSIEEVMPSLRGQLEQQALKDSEKERISAFESYLLEKYQFDLPASLLEKVRQERLAKQMAKLEEEALSDEEKTARRISLQENVAQDSERMVRLHFLNKQLIKQGNLTLSNEELNAAVQEHMKYYFWLYKENRDEKLRNLLSHLQSSLMERKLHQYVLAHVRAPHATAASVEAEVDAPTAMNAGSSR